MLDRWKCRRITFMELAIGAVEFVALVNLRFRRGWTWVTCDVHLGWEDGYIRICRMDKQVLATKLGLQREGMARLEKVLYWAYGYLVRHYLYGDTMSLLDYNRAFGRNLQMLREAEGLTIIQAAQVLGLTQERQRGFETGGEQIETDLCLEKTESVLYRAAAYFQIPASELLSQGLFYHVPVAGVQVCKEEMNGIMKEYNQGYGRKCYRISR